MYVFIIYSFNVSIYFIYLLENPRSTLNCSEVFLLIFCNAYSLTFFFYYGSNIYLFIYLVIYLLLYHLNLQNEVPVDLNINHQLS